MSKYNFIKPGQLVILIIAAVLSTAGCQEDSTSRNLPSVNIPIEKLRQIETIDLESVKAEPAPEEPDDTPAEEMKLTLEQCRALTLENNLNIKAQLIEPAIAAERVSEQEARFESAFYSNMTYSTTDTPTSTTLTGSQVDYSRVNLGVEVPLRTGGTLTFDMADSRTKTDNTFSTLDPSYISDFSISISQPLLRNAGTRVNTYAIRLAGYEQQIIDTQTKLELIRVIANADRWYWRLYAARRELDVRKKEYDLAKAQLEQAQRFVDVGARSMIEIIRAEAGAAERLEAIITAENNLRDRERELKKLLNKPGLDMQTATVLIPATLPDPVHYELDKQMLVTKALENRMEMLELELRIAADASTVDYMRNQALPLVTLDYRYNINGLGATRGDSLEMLGDKNFEDHQLGLRLLVPLGNGAAKSKLLQAFYQRRQRLATQKNRRALIELQVLNAIDQLEANWQRILASRQNAILAGRLFEAEKRQFEIGLGTSTDVLDAQTAFANAQSSEISALTEYQIALVDIAYATGTLLGSAKIQWEPIREQ
jgi:outer membrane protein TolC